jgi:PTS system nitrogen regulatory IIA component
MLISDLLNLESIRLDVQCSSKKKLLEFVSDELARSSPDLGAREIFESLFARERLGSTGLGKGVAIPHGRIKGNRAIQAVFVRLKKPLPFDAADGQPVDLVFAMAVPENCSDDHLKLLANVAELFSNAGMLRALREADSASTMLQLLSGTRSPEEIGTGSKP